MSALGGRLGWVRLGWLFNRRVAVYGLWALLLLVLAVVINVVGIALIGSVSGWQRWMAEASGYFLAWRLCLYGATIYGWRWMRQRLLAREIDGQAKHRLLRAEIAGVIAIVALEVSLLQAA